MAAGASQVRRHHRNSTQVFYVLADTVALMRKNMRKSSGAWACPSHVHEYASHGRVSKSSNQLITGSLWSTPSRRNLPQDLAFHPAPCKI